ncbi:MAG: MlaD family protein [Thermodesulfovibrionales bacterium]|jgi:paraquat-inducible protein B
MSKPINRSLIGIFVIGAISLVVAAVLILGSGRLLSPKEKFVLFFEGSVKGLDVGAPVIFRGVKVGEVKDIRLIFDPRDWSADIPVYIEINPKAFAVPENHSGEGLEKEYVPVQSLIERGLKAQLQMQSFVTGKLMLNLDLLPEKHTRITNLDTRYPEIPTIPTSLEELAKTLEDLDLPALSRKITSAVEGIERFVNSPELKESVSSMNSTIKDVGRLANNLNAQTGPVVASLRETSESARSALAKIEKSFSMEDGIPAQLGETLKTANASLQKAEETLASIQAVVQDNADMGYDIATALRELSASARSIRVLSDYLDRHPEALIRGKK